MKSIFSNNFDEGTWAGGGLDTIHDQLDTSRLATFSFTDDQGSPVYQDMIVSSITESFTEGDSLVDTLGDAFLSFATGASPIGITIQGFVLRLKGYDSRADLIDMYKTSMRGSAAQAQNKHLEFLLKQSERFTFALQQMQITENAQYPDFTAVTMQGVAFDFEIVSLEAASDTVAMTNFESPDDQIIA